MHSLRSGIWRAPPSVARVVRGEITVEAMAPELQHRDAALKQLRYHLGRVQDQMVKFANKKRKPSMI